VRRHVVEEIIAFLDVLAVVALRVAQAEKRSLRNGSRSFQNAGAKQRR
jgi:hypothetical protein